MIPVAPSPHPHQWSSNEMLNNKMNSNTTNGCKSNTPSNFNSSQKNMFACCHQGTKNISTTSCNNSSRSSNSPENRTDNCSNKNLVNLLASSNNKSNRVNLSYRISAPVHYFAHTSSHKQIDMYMDLSDCGERRCKNQNHLVHHHHHHNNRCMHQNQHHHFNNHHHHHHHQAYFNNNANPMQQPNIIQCGGNANMMELDSDGDAGSDCSYSAISTSTSGGGTAKKSRAMVFKRYLKLFQKNPTCGTITGSKKDWNKYLYYNQIMEYFNK